MQALALRLTALTLVLSASPALAGEAGSQVPEASSGLLFALGVLGVLVGRRGGMREKRKDVGGE